LTCIKNGSGAAVIIPRERVDGALQNVHVIEKIRQRLARIDGYPQQTDGAWT
jgi:hypothetical protein